ncbi:hypothetical protein [Mangrovicoccus ximenensis]|uniref:hypothetical protein n=1 Tax=Mangrovicoccus ximenensis TaxID=1911570 RepID=UPI0011AEAF37|nr:hypothetical protein [Mangrovicoccus ximenensis]
MQQVRRAMPVPPMVGAVSQVDEQRVVAGHLQGFGHAVGRQVEKDRRRTAVLDRRQRRGEPVRSGDHLFGREGESERAAEDAGVAQSEPHALDRPVAVAQRQAGIEGLRLVMRIRRHAEIDEPHGVLRCERPAEQDQQQEAPKEAPSDRR